MNQPYFRIDEDFETIIKNSLSNLQVKNCKLITTGWTNIVYEVETNDGAYFFRFPRDEFWTRTIVKDYEFGKYIHDKTDFETIELKIMYDNGRPYSVHRKIEGTPLAEKMKMLNQEEIKEVSDKIAKFMYQLHSLEYEQNKVFTVNNIGLQLDAFLTELLELHVSKEDRDFWKNRSNLKSNCLVHGDLNSSNILLDENNNIAAVIDFGFGGFGNKYDDIARIIGRCTPEFKDGILKSYEKYSGENVDRELLDQNILQWNNIDSGYINYMRKIGIYK